MHWADQILQRRPGGDRQKGLILVASDGTLSCIEMPPAQKSRLLVNASARTLQVLSGDGAQSGDHTQLKHLLAKRERELERTYRSLSWRLTGPLRGVKSLLLAILVLLRRF